MEKWALIMAGGKGERLWPLSTADRPKQLIPLFNGKTLLELAVERVEGVAKPLILTNELIASKLPSHFEVLIEPIPKNTGPALIYATAWLQERKGPVLIAALPSDHYIHPIESFRNLLEKAFTVADTYKSIVTFGIKPTYPHTGYGYIERGERLEDGVFKVLNFHEKPDVETATRYLKSRKFYWNSGMFVWRSDILLEEIKHWAPDIYSLLYRSGELTSPDEFFSAVESISIDYAVMEKTDRIVVIEGNFMWKDVGSYRSLYDILPKDAQGNAFRDDPPFSVDSSDNLVIGGGKRVVLVGLRGVGVIIEGDTVLVLALEKDQKVREAARLLTDS
ncbi:MAG: mannose-1-phosphate guanylyltransferase [Thermotogae bacterium]|nr:mannose-1-phosphate guanylyltransferase [Thermotogota bacterium]